MPDLLPEDEIARRLQDSAWERDGQGIARSWTFADFPAAMAFANAVAEAAEAEQHHPDISVHGWNHVTLSIFSHSVGGLTARDFEVAALFDALPGADG